MKPDMFIYILHKLKEWYMENNNIEDDTEFLEKNDFSILKVMKLLFFVSAQNKTLLNNFSFVARPYGPVEKEIYNFINQLKTDNEFGIIINNYNTKIFDNTKFNYHANNCKKEIKQEIDYSINELKKININLISYSAYKLVEISHKWSSWQIINLKNPFGEIDNNLIINNFQYYY